MAPAATGWVWPANGQVISGFSEGGNKGLSIAGAPGEAVFAAETGKVVYSGSGLRGYGNLVIVKHEQDVITAYAHNRAILVKEGQTVRRGQKIAELGMSDAERPMLLFEVRKGGKPVDPMTFLPTR
ncbi:MAG: peptidoglycan DD-metalloendopeptidase family protein [Burkholderiaceae bacterium]|nr:peptidoglycan DD-metalloendopeptidase family protein [Burkholderiaceae bacterium]MDP4677882.1 peptidoglycan DD-metalloendopeptidase family protein [Burkholderiaceae bacterium]MDP4828929.1 peptidoglycan DD-metalloendopeptidase family protein [Burkholderiaceae bacterium]MDP4919284.1 peptidoglycan DD-metalloendopeptidase family protein [Burkholderiaceae bacterium]MDP4948574.1 peptidoglycan DD-metalloendopeptidase family protein [Burkholderiaceae bacterium]